MRFKGSYKAAKLIKVSMDVDDEIIKNIRITGDFFMYPENAIRDLENILIGAHLDSMDLERRISKFLLENSVEVPMISVTDFVNAILSSKPEGESAS
ncbi:MAG: lipoate protein ligase C-terminal domain-containing protein [Candidatus Methanomethylicia archaeon]